MVQEANAINKSLTFLEQTVNALSRKEGHVPFRQSKLTSLLRDALGGNCKTVRSCPAPPALPHPALPCPARLHDSLACNHQTLTHQALPSLFNCSQAVQAYTLQRRTQVDTALQGIPYHSKMSCTTIVLLAYPSTELRCLQVMVANVWPEAAHVEETISTLRFAARVRLIETAPHVSESFDPSLMLKR